MIELMTSKLPPDDTTVTSIHPEVTPDEELVRHFLAGDEGAFDILVVRYQDRLFNFSMRFTSNASDAEEIVQETFIKAYKGLGRFRGDARVSTWLFQIAKNLCINKFHRKRRRMDHRKVSIQQSQHDDDLPLVQIEAEGPDAFDVLANQEINDVLQEAITELDPHFRSALILRDIEDLDYSEIAEILEVPVGTVKSRIHRARQELQRRLSPFVEELL